MNSHRTMFLTGAGGMVGRNLVDACPEGWRIVGPSRRECDLEDADEVERAMERACPDVVVHAAGHVGGIAANMARPARFLSDNLRIGLNVLERADRLGVNVINLASSCIYPPDAPNPLTEDLLLTGGLEPTNEGYALAKLAVLRYGQYCNRASRVARIKSLVPCNLYGRYDRFDPGSSHLVPAIIAKVHAATGTNAEVEIWGDGSARREFLYAGDLAAMIWYAIERFVDLPDVMNVGVGRDQSVLDYYTAAAAVMGWRGRFRFDLDRPVGMKRKLVETSHQKRLGFPLPCSLMDGLARTRDYYLETVSA